MTPAALKAFLIESNRIEGITEEPTDFQVEMAQWFLSLKAIAVDQMEAIVGFFQPNAFLRDKPGMDVRVGDYIPPRGGPEIPGRLSMHLKAAKEDRMPCVAYEIHCGYERLHPFTDCNGRSGRLLWLWMMKAEAPLGFLHTWYYQSLQEGR